MSHMNSGEYQELSALTCSRQQEKTSKRWKYMCYSHTDEIGQYADFVWHRGSGRFLAQGGMQRNGNKVAATRRVYYEATLMG